jgi:hypothetical protein
MRAEENAAAGQLPQGQTGTKLICIPCCRQSIGGVKRPEFQVLYIYKSQTSISCAWYRKPRLGVSVSACVRARAHCVRLEFMLPSLPPASRAAKRNRGRVTILGPSPFRFPTFLRLRFVGNAQLRDSYRSRSSAQLDREYW